MNKHVSTELYFSVVVVVGVVVFIIVAFVVIVVGKHQLNDITDHLTRSDSVLGD